MMTAAKHLDIITGIDIHIVQPPWTSPPIPIPHPFIGFVFDPDDYLPIQGSTVMINGLHAARTGTTGNNLPPHFPIIGGSFIKRIGNEAEIFMGSSTVLANGEPLSYTGLLVLSCHCIGMLPPPRVKKKSSPKSFFLPTSVVLPIPKGPPVLVGGTPIISMSIMAKKVGMKDLWNGFKKIRKLQKSSKMAKNISDKIHDAATKAMHKMKIPAKLQRKVHKGICTVTGHPVDVADGRVFTDVVDFEIQSIIPLIWERTWYSSSDYDGPIGHGWHHNYDMALAYDDAKQVVSIRMPDGRGVEFPYPEDDEPVFNSTEKLTLIKKEQEFIVTNKDYINHHFNITQKTTNDIILLTRISDRNGHGIDFINNHKGQLTKIIIPSKKELHLTYDDQGRIKNIELPHPSKLGERFTAVRYEYDDQGNLYRSIDAYDNYMEYAYEDHLLTRETNRNGLSFYFNYDGKGTEAKCLRTWGDGGIYDHKLTYKEGLTIVENSLGYKTHYYHRGGLVIKEIDPRGGELIKEYDEDNNLIAEINPLGYKTTYEYDDRGNKTLTIYPDSSKLVFQYEEDLLIGVIDQVGGIWYWEYEDNNLVKKIDPLGQETLYTYRDRMLSDIRQPNGGITSLAYDASVNLIRVTTPDGYHSSWKYDYLNRVLEATDPKGNVQKRKYDFLGNILRINEPDGNTRNLQYDTEGNVKNVKDKHYDVSFRYGGMNRMIERVQAGTRVKFEYDKEENLTTIINELGYQYEFELDENGDVKREIGFDNITREYIRDLASNVVGVKRPNGTTTKYTYDPMDRVTGVYHEDGSKELFGYRADGELIEATNDTISLKMERDLLRRIISEDQGGYMVYSSYDESGMRSEVKTSFGTHIEIGRTLMGDVEKLSANGSAEKWEATYKRDAHGLEIERIMPGDVKSTWKRDRLGRPIHHQVSTRGTSARSRTYTWDVDDRLKKLVDSSFGTTSFEHDVFGNLSAATYGDGTRELRNPDVLGNLFKTDKRTDRKYGRAGQILEADGIKYDYDVEGNMISKKETNRNTWLYKWNASGMLKEVIRPDGRSVYFIYDALGRRVSKTYLSKTTRWLWDGNIPIHEWVIAAEDFNLPVTKFLKAPIDYDQKILDNGAPINGPPDIITWIFEPESFAPVAKITDQKQLSVVCDHLGTSKSLIDVEGKTSWSSDSSIFGEVSIKVGESTDMPFRYPGQYEDVETGLYYNRFRYYSPENGTYISQDPIGLFSDETNFYTYVNDSNYWVDPLGLSRKSLSSRLPEGSKTGIFGPKNGVLVKSNPQTGDIIQIRTYDGDRNPIKDIDFGPDHGAGSPHAHDWVFPSKQAPNKVRSKGRVLNGDDLDLIDKVKNGGCT